MGILTYISVPSLIF